jgi:superfamily I DNA/RNA helicase
LGGRRPVSSAMSMSTRSELEEERRLFYVALTCRASGLFEPMHNRATVGETDR